MNTSVPVISMVCMTQGNYSLCCHIIWHSSTQINRVWIRHTKCANFVYMAFVNSVLTRYIWVWVQNDLPCFSVMKYSQISPQVLHSSVMTVEVVMYSRSELHFCHYDLGTWMIHDGKQGYFGEWTSTLFLFIHACLIHWYDSYLRYAQHRLII